MLSLSMTTNSPLLHRELLRRYNRTRTHGIVTLFAREKDDMFRAFNAEVRDDPRDD